MNICLSNILPQIDISKIYVVCKASEQRGILYGTRINAFQSFKAMMAQIKEMLTHSSPVPNLKVFVIKDYHGFGSFEIEPDEPINRVRIKALLVVACKELRLKLVVYYYGDLAQATDAIHSRYAVVYDSELTYSAALFNTHYLLRVVHVKVHSYIDYQQFQRAIFERDFFSI